MNGSNGSNGQITWPKLFTCVAAVVMPLVAISVGTWNNILNSIEHSTQVASQERSRIEDKVIKELHRAINEHAAHPHANGVSRRELDRLEAQLREKIDASTRDR